MAIKDVQSSLGLVDSHLSGYLRALRSSTDIHIQIQSRWPWVTEVVVPYPNSLLDRLVLFVKTLRFCVPKEVKDRFFQRSMESLHIYKNAIKYQLLAHEPVYLDREKKALSNEKFLCELENLERNVLDKREIAQQQKEFFREWGGSG